MPTSKLKTALNDCLINFDQRVLLTDLLNEYQLPYDEVHSTLQEYMEKHEQEQGTKFEKRFLVHGTQTNGDAKEIYTVVNSEKKVKEWLQQLTEAESKLYSVEIAGGAKAPAEVLKPLRWCAIKVEDTEIRDTKSNSKANEVEESKATVKSEVALKEIPSSSKAGTNKNEKPTSAAVVKQEKPPAKPSAAEKKSSPPEKKPPANEHKKSPTESKKSPPEKKANEHKKSPTESKKSPPEKKAKMGGINAFFAPASKTKATVSKSASASSTQKSPKKMQDFFSDNDDESKNEVTMVDSSDEEEQLQALREKVDAAEKASSSGSCKRRRIMDSDEEEDEAPQQKHEKREEENEVELVEEPKSQTYLDEEGFVMTIKSKKSTSTKAKTPAKVLEVQAPAKPKPKTETKATPKTKQGNIMNFFSKK